MLPWPTVDEILFLNFETRANTPLTFPRPHAAAAAGLFEISVRNS